MGTPYTRPSYNYCNRSCNSKSSEATIITISLTDKVQPNIFVMVSHRTSCCLVKAVQQSFYPASECPPVCFAKAVNAVGRTDSACCWETRGTLQRSSVAVIGNAHRSEILLLSFRKIYIFTPVVSIQDLQLPYSSRSANAKRHQTRVEDQSKVQD